MMVIYPLHLKLGRDTKVREHELTMTIAQIRGWKTHGLEDANFDSSIMTVGLQHGKIVVNKDYPKCVLEIEYYKSKAYRSDQMFCVVCVDSGASYTVEEKENHQLEDEDRAQIDVDVIQEVHKRRAWFMREARFHMWLEFNLEKLSGCTPAEALIILEEDGWL